MTIKTTMIAAFAGVTLLFGGAALAAGHGHGHGQAGGQAGAQASGMPAGVDAPCDCTDGTCPMHKGGAAHGGKNDGTCPVNADGTKADSCKNGTCNHGGQAGHMGGKHMGGKHMGGKHGGGKHGGGMCDNKHGGSMGGSMGGGMTATAFTVDDARSVLDQKIQLKKDASLKIGTITQVDAAFIRGTIVDGSGKLVADYIFAVATGDWTKVN